MSEHRAEISRANGAQSDGPKTPEGRAIAAMNRTEHGLAAHGALLPGETQDSYNANLETWIESVNPQSPGELQIAVRVADTNFRFDRLARLEQRLLADELERKVTESQAHRSLVAAQEAKAGVEGLAQLAERMTGEVPGAELQGLFPGMQMIAARVRETGVAPGLSSRLSEVLHMMATIADEQTDVDALTFVEIAGICRELSRKLVEPLRQLEAEEQRDRERVAEKVGLGEDKASKLIDRHRARLGRELESHMTALKAVRELAAMSPGPAPGSFVPIIRVDLRVLGRKPEA